jgi:penicillin-binding protein 1A
MLLLFVLALGLWQGLNLLVRLAVPVTITPATWADQVWQSSRIFSSDGQLLYTWGQERRRPVPLGAISPDLVTAVLAVEDAQFYQHQGISWVSVLRAMLANLREGRMAQGGSTITQQVARALYLSTEKKLGRKLAEALLAKRLDDTLTKDEILTLYLNSIYWGAGAYGAEEAARTYFCKSAATLNRSEVLLLAGIISAPERFNPLKYPDRAAARFQHAHQRLKDYLQAHNLPPPARGLRLPQCSPCQVPPYAQVAHAVLRARTLLTTIVGQEAADRGGFDLTLGLSWRHQQALLAALNESLETGILASLGPGPVLAPGKPSKLPKTPCRVLPGHGYWGRLVSYGDDVARVDFGSGPGLIPLDRFRWPAGLATAGPPEPGYWVKASPDEASDLCGPEAPLFSPLLSPQVAALLVSAKGELLAWSGGQGASTFDRALDARRNVGSTIKPFVYLAAMMHWNWTPSTIIPQDWPNSFKGKAGTRWKPQEHGPDFTKTPVTLEESLRLSLNGPAVAVAHRLGLPELRRSFEAFGLPARPMPDLSVALGNLSLSPYDLAVGYGLFFRGGKGLAPHPLATITDRNRREVFKGEAALRGQAPPLLCKAMANLLRTVVDRGTGRLAHRKDRISAGKTGTSNAGADAWFVGFRKDLLLVVWVGTDDGAPLKDLSGPKVAAPLWGEIMDRLEAIPQ